MKQPWVALRSYSRSGLGHGYGVSLLALVVGKIFLNYCFMMTFVVAGERGRCLDMRSSMITGKVVRWLFFSLDQCRRCGAKTCGMEELVQIFLDLVHLEIFIRCL